MVTWRVGVKLRLESQQSGSELPVVPGQGLSQPGERHPPVFSWYLTMAGLGMHLLGIIA